MAGFRTGVLQGMPKKKKNVGMRPNLWGLQLLILVLTGPDRWQILIDLVPGYQCTPLDWCRDPLLPSSMRPKQKWYAIKVWKYSLSKVPTTTNPLGTEPILPALLVLCLAARHDFDVRCHIPYLLGLLAKIKCSICSYQFNI